MSPVLASKTFRLLAAGLLAWSIVGCQKSHTSPGSARMSSASVRAASADSGDDAVIGDLALLAHASLTNADKAYKALRLDKSAGRKMDPKREGATIAGLKPVIARFEADAAAIANRLTGQFNTRTTPLLDEFEKRRPHSKDGLPATATASDMVYRVAQYRVKFGFLVEYALRTGALPGLPGQDQPAKPAEPLPGDTPADELDN